MAIGDRTASLLLFVGSFTATMLILVLTTILVPVAGTPHRSLPWGSQPDLLPTTTQRVAGTGPALTSTTRPPRRATYGAELPRPWLSRSTSSTP